MASKPLELVIERTFDAPRELVWKAWTDPSMLKKWNAPKAFVVTLAEGELREGGKWRGGMKSKEHGELFAGGVYKEIKKPERLVFTHVWEGGGEEGGVETTVVVEFTENHGKTTMVFTQTGFGSIDSRDGHRDGWSECFDRLELALTENS